MLLPMLVLLHTSQPVHIQASLELRRGARVYGDATTATYQDVEDTVIDRAAPDVNHGGDYTLLVGDGRTLLIRFGDLRNVIPVGSKVVDASLTLTTTGGLPPTLFGIGALRESWGEGPYKTLGNTLKPGVEAPQYRDDLFAATWKQRFAGTPWLSPGGGGTDPISDAKSAAESTHLTVTGMAGAVNAMLANPSQNHGFALQFSSDGEFFSSESSTAPPTLHLSLAPSESADDSSVSVESIVPVAGGFAATVANHSKTRVSDIRPEWRVNGGVISSQNSPIDLAPEATQTIKVEATVRANGSDHRVGTVGLRLTGAASSPGNELTVFAAGIPISALLSADVAKELAGAHSARGVGAANWVQSQIDFVNDTVLARSRYSFATDGCLERVRLAEVKLVGPLVDGPAPIGAGVEVTSNPAGHPALDFDFIRRVLLAIGAPDLGADAFPRESTKVHVPGFDVGGGTPFPDLTGGGDTRYDGGLARQLLLSQVPVPDPINAAAGVEPSGLLSAVAVGGLNALVGVPLAGRRTAMLNELAAVPGTVLATAADAVGLPLKNANLTFYQSHQNGIADHPVFTLSTGDSGSVILPKRSVPDSALKNFIGSKDVIADGTFLVHAVTPSGSGWAWLRGWQLVEARYRGDADFASVPLNFFMAGAATDRTHNRAAGRGVTDSRGSLPAKLAGMVDGVGRANVELPQKVGEWVEIDLNRDWTLSELRLTSIGGAPWSSFAVKVYQTGQSAGAAIDWFTETNWRWALENRGETGDNQRQSVRYRGQPVQIRYIRIVCLKPGGVGLAQVEAYSPTLGG